MEADLEYIRQLYLQKLTGELTPEEEQELAAAMEDPRVRKMCKDLDELYQSPEMIDLLRVRPTHERWTELTERVMERASEPLWYEHSFRWVAAACLVILAGFGIYLLRMGPSNSVDDGMAQVLRPMEPEVPATEVRLSFATGERLALTGDIERKLAGVKVTAEGKTLRLAEEVPAGDGWTTLEVPVCKDYKVVLADGTEVWLNAATELRFPVAFNGDVREVTVRGEAYFNVARDARKPFIVHTPEGDIRVLGTAFNVNTYDAGKVYASLVRGSIKAVSGGTEALLKPGQSAEWNRSSPKITVKKFDAEQALSWMEGVQYFHGADVEEMSRTIKRWYNLDVVIDNPLLTNLRIEGRLDKQRPIGEFLTVLQLARGVNHRIADNTVHLY
ncbi:FecR domain-containing protein [Chitinophaga lutea]